MKTFYIQVAEFAHVATVENWIPINALKERAAEKFTSRDGFSSFYSPDVEDWGPIDKRDCNQVGTLIECEAGTDFDQFKELYLMDDAHGNGNIETWLSDSTSNIQRLYKIHDYLETRAHRG